MKWTTITGLFALLISANSLFAQAETGRIIGTVTEAQTARPLAGVSVSIPGTGRGTLSGPNGQFIITNVPAGTHTARAQLIGFSAQETTVTVNSNQAVTANFQLQPEAVQLEGIVAVGYGTQRRRDITGAVASVNTEALERAPIVAIDQALQGTVPGVQVTTASSAPGGGISVRIRGGTSLSGANEPLYVVDGFPLENDESGSPGTGGRADVAGSNPLSGLNPNDIESIEILKDASATAIYGARGANGVVLITTKRGRVGRPRVTFDTYAGTQEVAKRYELLNAREFALYANEWAASQTSGDRSPIFPNPDALGEGTDWQD
ncbi:MAG TPA: TonB-dependent receptor plug domain-containing protein, partial [Chloroflexota bacterium]|nr:TonB-dependent receptor plug domain-containing protein [Chloroflexota bacterium]